MASIEREFECSCKNGSMNFDQLKKHLKEAHGLEGKIRGEGVSDFYRDSEGYLVGDIEWMFKDGTGEGVVVWEHRRLTEGKNAGGFQKDVQLDATLIRAAMHGSFTPCVSQLGMLQEEAIARMGWLRQQPDEYIEAVSELVAEAEIYSFLKGVKIDR